MVAHRGAWPLRRSLIPADNFAELHEHRRTTVLQDMIEESAVAVFVIAPAKEPDQCLAHYAGGGVKLPKSRVDAEESDLKAEAENILEQCPSVSEWVFTSCTDEYSYVRDYSLRDDDIRTRDVVQTFLVVATKWSRGSEYQWVDIAGAEDDFTHDTVIPSMMESVREHGVTGLGVEEAAILPTAELSPQQRAEKVDQGTTLEDF